MDGPELFPAGDVTRDFEDNTIGKNHQLIVSDTVSKFGSRDGIFWGFGAERVAHHSALLSGVGSVS